MKTHLITTDEAFFALHKSWGGLHDAVKGGVCQTFEWNASWWRLYKGQFELRVLSLWSDGQLVGVLPLFLERVSLGLLKISRLKFIGAYEIYGEYGPLVHPSCQTEVIKEMASVCVTEIVSGRWDMIDLIHFAETSTVMPEWFRAMEEHGLKVRFTPHSAPRVIVELPADWSAYLKSLSKNERHQFSRSMKLLSNNGAELEILKTLENFPKAFDDFVRIHTAAWIDRGSGGFFLSRTHFRDFQDDVIPRLMKRNAARLYFLKKDGTRFSVGLVFFMHGQCCIYLGALDRNCELAKYGAGRVLMCLIIKDAISEGCSVFDFGEGDEDYKLRLGGKMAWFSRAVIWNKGLLNYKVLMLFTMQTVHRFVIKSVWKRRILPRIRSVLPRFEGIRSGLGRVSQ
jgi:CelD/BcsL family acetyltransferase involved in cellulose biosynthesis